MTAGYDNLPGGPDSRAFFTATVSKQRSKTSLARHQQMHCLYNNNLHISHWHALLPHVT